jgi:CHAT domain-containing protein
MLNMLATVHEALGDPHAALAAWQEALGIVESAGRSDVAPLHGGLCTAFRSTGELEQALRHCHAGVDVARRAKSSGLGFALLNLAALQRLLGEPEKAIPLYEQARDAFRPMGGVVELAALTRLAQARLEAGDVTGAAAGFSEALAFGRAHGAEDDPMTLLLAALAEQARGETAAAREGFEKALAGFRKLSDVPRTALALRSLADLDAVADPAKALERQREALALQEGAGDGDAQAQTLYGMALVHRGQGELAEARARIEAAIALVESLRGRLADPDLKATFLATRKDYYDLLADVLLRMHERDPAAGHDRAAFEANERGLTRSLLDLLAEARVDVRAGAEPELLERERRLREHVAAKAQRAAARGADAEMRGELERLLAEQARVLSELRRNSPRFASLVLPEPLPAPALQALLGPDELLLEFSLGRGGAVLYAVGARSLRAHRLKERERIDALARDLHALWAGPAARAAEPQARRLARELGQLLLAPVADLLAGKRLVIVADGVLVFVPFAALPSPRGGRPLVADHEIVHLPSLSALAQLRADRPSLAARELDVAVLADPVLSAEDARVAGGASGPASVTPEDEKLLRSARESFGEERLPRLPFTRREADAIAALVPDGRALKALDFAASRDLALSGELRRARFVHFATHGLVNARHPALSGLVLSLVDEGGRTRDGFLRLQDVYNTRLDAELVVLSGCRTALGREVRGEGLVGLTRGFFYAGAPRLVASLWDVRDRSAAELMRRLYEGLLKRGERPAQALRSAQLALLRDPAWSSPRHWAAFALHGDWR